MVMNLRNAKIMGSIFSFNFMVIHAIFLFIFIKYSIPPMAKINVISVLFYFFLIFGCHFGWLRLFTVGIYLEVIIHMFFAVIYTGWDSGFQYTMLGMNVVVLYSEYVGRNLKIKKVIPMMPFGFLGLALYLSSYIIVYFNGAPYSLPKNINFFLNIILGIVVVSITLIVMQIFILIVNSSEKKLEFQLSHDHLTGLPNRYYFADKVKEIKEEEGLEGYWCAIFDIDHFKSINDTYGHNCGDYVLSTLGDMVLKSKIDNCCRWGGEEFVVLAKFDSEDDAYAYFDERRKEVEAYDFKFNGFPLKVTITIGMAACTTRDAQGNETWISEADEKLYYGKNHGKNQVVR